MKYLIHLLLVGAALATTIVINQSGSVNTVQFSRIPADTKAIPIYEVWLEPSPFRADPESGRWIKDPNGRINLLTWAWFAKDYQTEIIEDDGHRPWMDDPNLFDPNFWN